MKRLVFLTVCIVAAGTILPLSLTGCGQVPDEWANLPGPPRVLATFPPLYCFTKNVAGDQAGIITLCTTTGPHDYQFNIRDAALLRKADLFLSNGLSLDEHFADKMHNNSGNPNLVYVKLGDALPRKLRIKGDPDAHHHHDHEEGHHHHHHGEFDPHVWLGIPQAVAMVERIRDELKKADPDHAGLYDKNAAEYVGRLKKLQEYRKDELKALKSVPVITYHESMRYFADSFGLNVAGSITRSGIDPSGQALAELRKKVRDRKRVIIAVEPQYSQGHAQTLANDLKTNGNVAAVDIVIVDPLETCERGALDPSWYERKMRQNVDNLLSTGEK